MINFHLKLQTSKTLVIEDVMSVYIKNLGCSPTSDVINLEFIMMQVYLNASD